MGGLEMDNSFVGILGDNPRVKLWEFLLVSRGNFEYHVKDLADGANITRPTCYKELKDLMKRRIVVKGQKYKGKQLYKLNKDSKIAKLMMKSFKSLIYMKN